jgi:CRP/FNR family transcriptional regulator, nitrogen fixation regulation protein
MLLCNASVPAETVDPLCGIAASLSPIRTIVSYGRGEQVYRESDLAAHWYRVVTGAVRKYTVLADGRRQIVDFLLPGDFFGFRERHQQSFATDAITNGTTVARYARREVEVAADRNLQLAREIRELLLEAVSRSQARLLILGRMRSVEKVGAFLLEMAERCLDRRDRAVIVLPMSRYDIADYLGLSVESVSRALTRLCKEGVIRFVDKHRISIIDRDLLEVGIGWHGEQTFERPLRLTRA